MCQYTIYTYPNNPRAQQALIAAQYTGTQIDVPAFQMGSENKTAAFLAKNPVGKVPVLDTPSGPIFESNAILRYIAKLSPSANLFGHSFHDSALVEQWIDFASFEIAPKTHIWVWPILGIIKNDAKATAAAKTDVLNSLKVIDAHLKYNTFMVGNSVTLADISMVCTVKRLFELVLPVKVRSTMPYLTRWFTTCINQPEFIAVIGSFKFAETEASADAKPVETNVSKQVEKIEKVEAEVAPKKAKNPLDLLPPSSMSLDASKKLFSNLEHDAAVKEFWANFDAEGYCIYECNYKYNAENTVYFMTCNLMGGFIQRLDALRKYGFGTLALTGPDDGPYDIVGAWLFRGNDIPAEMSESTDAEFYTFKKLDATSEEGRQRWNDLVGADVVDGKTVHERKYFK